MAWKYYGGKNRFGAKKTTYNGVKYHSKKEALYAMELDLRIKANDIKKWDRQVKISIDLNGEHICNYLIDFKIYHNNGQIEFVEVKGFETALWKLKWKLFKAKAKKEFPEAILTIVK